MQRTENFPYKNYKCEFFRTKRLIVTLWLQDVIFYANAFVSRLCGNGRQYTLVWPTGLRLFNVINGSVQGDSPGGSVAGTALFTKPSRSLPVSLC
jgi:hypothetical protein